MPTAFPPISLTSVRRSARTNWKAIVSGSARRFITARVGPASEVLLRCGDALLSPVLPPEIHRWSVSAIRVEPDFIWLGLYHFGEYGGDPGDVFLRWDRKTEEVRLFNVRRFISQISRHRDALYLSGFDGIDVLRGDEIQSYFVDRTVDGRYEIVERTVR